MKFFNWFGKKENSIPTIDKSTLEMIITLRSHGLMTLWAAERMGKTSESAANYADEVVDDNINDEDFLARINEDLVFHEQHVDMSDLQERLKGFRAIAKLEHDDETNHAKKMHKLQGDC